MSNIFAFGYLVYLAAFGFMYGDDKLYEVVLRFANSGPFLMNVVKISKPGSNLYRPIIVSNIHATFFYAFIRGPIAAACNLDCARMLREYSVVVGNFRGVGTSARFVLDKILLKSHRWIVEYDIANFFPTVKIVDAIEEYKNIFRGDHFFPLTLKEVLQYLDSIRYVDTNPSLPIAGTFPSSVYVNQGGSVSVELCQLVHNAVIREICSYFRGCTAMVYVDDTVLGIDDHCGVDANYIQFIIESCLDKFGLRAKFVRVSDLYKEKYVLVECPSISFTCRNGKFNIGSNFVGAFRYEYGGLLRDVTSHVRSSKDPRKRDFCQVCLR